MAIELEGLEFQIESNAEKASKGVDALTNSLEKLKNVTQNNAGFKKLTNSLSRLDQALSGFQNADKLNQLAQGLSALGSASSINIPSSLARKINQLTRAASGITGGMVQNLNGFAQAMQTLGTASNVNIPRMTAAGATGTGVLSAGGAQNSETTAIAAGVAEVTEPVRQATKEIQSAADAATRAIPRFKLLNLGFRAATTGAKTLFRSLIQLPMAMGSRLAAAVKNATSSLAGFGRALKRIIMYRALRSMIKAFTQGFSEGLKNLYNYSLMIEGQFAKSMNSLASSSLYLKNSLAAMASPIINALAPAIEFITDKIVYLLNLINQLFAKLSGKDTYTVAKKVETQWGDVTDGISKGAKQASDAIKRYLLGFDELNILGKNNDSSGSGGSGGGGGSTDYSSMFEEKEIDSSVSEFATNLKNAFENQDWTGLGQIIGTKINECISAVDWPALGQKTGNLFTAAIQTAYSLLSTVDFVNVGSSIAQFLSGAINNVDWETLGRLMVRRFTALMDVGFGFITDFDFGGLGTAIHDAVTGVFKEAKEWLDGKEWDQFGGKLIKDLKDLLEGMNIGDLFENIFGTAGSAINAARELIGGALGELTITIENWWDELDGDDAGEKLLSGIADLGTWTKNNVTDPFFNSLLGDERWKTLKKDINQYISEIPGAVIELKDEAKSKIFDIGVSAGQKLYEGWTSVKSFFSSWWDDFKNDFDHHKEKAWAEGNLKLGLSVDATLSEKLLRIMKLVEDPENYIDVIFRAAPLEYKLAKIMDIINNPNEANVKFLLNIKNAEHSDDFLHQGFQTVLNFINAPDEIKKTIAIAINIAHGGSSSGNFVEEGFMKVIDFCNGPNNLTKGVSIGIKFFNETQGSSGNPIEKELQKVIDFVDGATKKVNVDVSVGGGGAGGDNTLHMLSKSSVNIDVILKKGSNSPTISELFGSTLSVITDIAKKKDANTVAGLFGSTLGVATNITKAKGANSISGLFGSALNVATNITKKKGANTIAGLFGASLAVSASLKKASNTKTITGLFGNTLSVLANIAKGKVSGTSTVASIVGLFGSSFTPTANIKAGKVAGTSKSASLTNLFGSTITVIADIAKSQGHAGGGAVDSNGYTTTFASGGAITNMSRETWGRIPKYAGGGMHGSLFIAGEAGPEIVGHVGGRSEILNKSQLAQTMHAAVISGMGQFVPYLSVIANHVCSNQQFSADAIETVIDSMSGRVNGTFYGEDSTDKIADGVRDGMYDITTRQNELLREQNDLLRRIAEKDTSVEITANSISRALRNQSSREGF